MNATPWVWSLIRSVLLLALVNWGLYHASRAAFTYRRAPSFATLLRYTFARAFGGHVTDVLPADTAAHVVSIAAPIIVLTTLLGLAASVALSVWGTGEHREIDELLTSVRTESRRFDRDFSFTYGASPDVSIDRLERLNKDPAGVLTRLAARIAVHEDPEIGHATR